MALIAVAADKGAPGVTTSAVAMAAVWPRPVLLAECDPAGGDIVYRLPGADGQWLDPRRGLLSLAVAARRGLQPAQVWEHAQKLHGGLDVLAGVASAEQGAGLEALWDVVGGLLAKVPQADVIADCGRIGGDGPFYDLLAEADAIVLITRASLADVVRLRDRTVALASALHRRGRSRTRVSVVVIADHKTFKTALAEVGHAIGSGTGPASVIGALAYEPKSAEQLRGQWGGKLDRSLLVRTAREIVSQIAAQLPDAQWSAAGEPALPDAPGQVSQPHTGPAGAAPQPNRAGSGAGQRPAQPQGPRPGPARPAPLLSAPPGQPDPPRVTRPEPDEPPAPSARAGSMPRGRHAGRPAPPPAQAEREQPDHLKPLPGLPPAAVPGGPAASPGDQGGW
jgi:hypothetical protein